MPVQIYISRKTIYKRIYLTAFKLPQYPELFNLKTDEKRALMYISSSPEHYEVESCILRSLAYAVASRSSDVHFNARLVNGKTSVFINIRTKAGFVNIPFTSGTCDAAHFEIKLLQLTNNTIGGTQAEIISTRFSLDFPSWWAKDQGLQADPGHSYKTDVRVQFQKTFEGFSVVCRILDQQSAPKLSEIGLTFALEQEILRVIHEPSGLVLVSGPTGSGKTTLLNAMLGELNDGSRAIFTIENPVEFRLKGMGPITQVQTHGMVSFAQGLRSALRSDPDVILIGEIRDSETMEVALQAAQTGHLVLATIHASNCAQTIGRMLDLTLDKRRDAFRVAETLKLVLAQRLIERYELTPQTKVPAKVLQPFEKDWLLLNRLATPSVFTENQSIKKVGLSALIEAITVDQNVKNMIRRRVFNTEDIYIAASNQLSFETLAMGGMRTVEAGHSKLSDCILKLDSQSSHGASNCLRASCAVQYGLSYSEISRQIDEFTRKFLSGELSEVTSVVDPGLEQATSKAEQFTDYLKLQMGKKSRSFPLPLTLPHPLPLTLPLTSAVHQSNSCIKEAY